MKIKGRRSKKKRKKKLICPECKVELEEEFCDCPFCGGGYVYECPKCLEMYDEQGLWI